MNFLYLGPYFVCTPYNKKVSRKDFSCESCNEIFFNYIFCPMCGKKLKVIINERLIRKQVKVNISKELTYVNYNYDLDYYIWTPKNYSGILYKTYEIGEDFEWQENIIDEVKKKELDEVKERFYNKLKSKYYAVDLEWGLLVKIKG